MLAVAAPVSEAAKPAVLYFELSLLAVTIASFVSTVGGKVASAVAETSTSAGS